MANIAPWWRSILRRSGNAQPACRCQSPPFHYTDYETSELGDDSHWASVSLERCRHCGTHWLKYLIEEEYRTGSGRWWRVAVPESDLHTLTAENAREYVERQSRGFLGGSYFDSTGSAYSWPVTIR